MRLQNWNMIFLQEDKFRVTGNIFGSQRWENGEMIRSSVVISFNVETMVAHTQSGTSYELGVMHPDFVRWLRENKKKLKDFHNP